MCWSDKTFLDADLIEGSLVLLSAYSSPPSLCTLIKAIHILLLQKEGRHTVRSEQLVRSSVSFFSLGRVIMKRSALVLNLRLPIKSQRKSGFAESLTVTAGLQWPHPLHRGTKTARAENGWMGHERWRVITVTQQLRSKVSKQVLCALICLPHRLCYVKNLQVHCQILTRPNTAVKSLMKYW